MSDSHFIQIHTLTSYPATLLNRDDVGLAKRIPFGGAVRTRISSQCLKRHWRRHEGEFSISNLVDGQTNNRLEPAVRSRISFEHFVREPLTGEGVDAELALAATEAVMIAVLGESAKAKAAKGEEAPASEDGNDAKKSSKKAAKPTKAVATVAHTNQVTVLGRPELDFFLQEARAIAREAKTVANVKEVAAKRFTKDWGKNLDGLRLAAGIDAALFGRMVTSDILARTDSAVHVAHAFTVHAEETETDYFSAVDDLVQVDQGQLGSGHIGTAELTSGLYYGYVAIDVGLLVSNLEGVKASEWKTGDRKLAAKVVESLVNLIPRVTPGAKLGSTAPHAYASFLLVESGSNQPRTLANAFLKPVRARIDGSGHTDVQTAAIEGLAKYVKSIDDMYGITARRAFAIAQETPRALEVLGKPSAIADVAKFAASALLEA